MLIYLLTSMLICKWARFSLSSAFTANTHAPANSSSAGIIRVPYVGPQTMDSMCPPQQVQGVVFIPSDVSADMTKNRRKEVDQIMSRGRMMVTVLIVCRCIFYQNQQVVNVRGYLCDCY